MSESTSLREANATSRNCVEETDIAFCFSWERGETIGAARGTGDVMGDVRENPSSGVDGNEVVASMEASELARGGALKRYEEGNLQDGR